MDGTNPLLENGYPELKAQLKYLSKDDRAKIEKAYLFALVAHRTDKRKSGEPYITHPVAVAAILAELELDVETIKSALLHDTIEDTSVTAEEIEREFGQIVRRIVEGETKVSKVSKLAKQHLEDEQAENLRQLLVAMTTDVRIILVKLADRLHNMRTLNHMSLEKQQRIARETLEIYAPLAHRLGIGQIKWELEDLSFQYLEPQAYKALENKIQTNQHERDTYIQKAIDFLRKVLETDRELGRWLVRFEISGRSKHLYSIHRKMLRDEKAIEEIFDLLAVRVILHPKPVNDTDINIEFSPDDSEETRGQKLIKAKNDLESSREKRICYHTLGIVHSTWTPLPGRFKDYIAVPKPNGYQSLHSTVIALDGQPIEVQIRTLRMHQVAEFGVAAHWLYKSQVEDPAEVQKRLGLNKRGLNLLEELKTLQNEIKDAGDFIDAVRSDLLGGRVFVFTPKGDTVNLPVGSTPIDFAYHVHTDVGRQAVGARVNGQIVPLSYKLQNGDRVEVIVNRNSNPSKDWLSWAVSRSARTNIRQFFRAQERTEALVLGQESLARYLRKRGLPAAKLMRSKTLEDVSHKLLGSRNPDDLFVAIQLGRINNTQVARILAPEHFPAAEIRQPRKTKIPEAGVVLEGDLNIPVRLAQCCKPLRGDEIVGFVTRGRGVTVHRKNCPSAKRYLAEEPGRFLSAAWFAGVQKVIDLEVIASDRPSLLKDVLDALNALGKTAVRVEASLSGRDEAHIRLRIETDDFGQIKETLLKITEVNEVIKR